MAALIFFCACNRTTYTFTQKLERSVPLNNAFPQHNAAGTLLIQSEIAYTSAKRHPTIRVKLTCDCGEKNETLQYSFDYTYAKLHRSRSKQFRLVKKHILAWMKSRALTEAQLEAVT